MARLPLPLVGMVIAGMLLVAPGPSPAAPAPTDQTAALTARLAIFRTPMRHPLDEIRPVTGTLSPEAAALAAARTSRLVADTPDLRVWAALDAGRLRLITAFKNFDPSLGPPPVAGEEPEPAWTEFFLLRGKAGGTYTAGKTHTRVLLVADGARRAVLVHADGTARRLRIRHNTIVVRVRENDRVVYRDRAGRPRT